MKLTEDVGHIFWWEGFLGLTYRFSSIGLEMAIREEIIGLLVKSDQLEPVTGMNQSFACNLKMVIDSEGNDLWSMDVFVGIVDRTFVRIGCWDESLFVAPLAWVGGVLISRRIFTSEVYEEIEATLRDRVEDEVQEFKIPICSRSLSE